MIDLSCFISSPSLLLTTCAILFFSPCSSSVRVFDDREDVTHPPSLVTTGAMPFIINHREPCHWSQRLHRRSGSCTRDLLSPWRRGVRAGALAS
ncbi:hypothetical protein Bca52824_039604 [Brassica carinata]|uniref:Secreted protein n=1 Tax=Brassica carinata TaxID=52824 RepID=A0A8X7UUR1_BRACI|nr:hypothetical protein Bca52824_039604 [Brassica carinata]